MTIVYIRQPIVYTPWVLEIAGWEWDDANLFHFGRGLSRRVVLEVAANAPLFRTNKKHRAATYQMIGPDHGGRMWTICIVQRPGPPGIWRAITGWPSEEPEQTWYRRSQ